MVKLFKVSICPLDIDNDWFKSLGDNDMEDYFENGAEPVFTCRMRAQMLANKLNRVSRFGPDKNQLPEDTGFKYLVDVYKDLEDGHWEATERGWKVKHSQRPGTYFIDRGSKCKVEVSWSESDDC